MQRNAVAFLATAILSLTACDSTETAQESDQRLYDTERRALEKARGVEHTLQQQAERQRRQIEQDSR